MVTSSARMQAKTSRVSGSSPTAAQVRMLTEQVEHLQREIGELAERMDFTERVLAKQKDRDRLLPNI